MAQENKDSTTDLLINIPLIENFNLLENELIPMPGYGVVFKLKSNDRYLVKAMNEQELYACVIASTSIAEMSTTPVGPILVGYCLVPESKKNKYLHMKYLLKMEYIEPTTPVTNFKENSEYEETLQKMFRTLAERGLCNNDINSDSLILEKDGNIRLIDYGLTDIQINVDEHSEFIKTSYNHMMSQIYPKKYKNKFKSIKDAIREEQRRRQEERLSRIKASNTRSQSKSKRIIGKSQVNKTERKSKTRKRIKSRSPESN
jgi:hypothetical protein